VTGVFRTSTQVRFAHCDAAGWMFYPRALELVNGVVEDWFAEDLGKSFKVLHLDDGLGVPTVRLESEFHSPARLGDNLDFELTVTTLGRASVDLAIAASTDGTPRFTARLKIVFTELADAKSTPIPDAIRVAMQPYVAAP
jgi:4-hydroxybenzoyl-CoA thioesterase